MRNSTENSAERPTRFPLWTYNVRILIGNTYWLIVTPIAATQLVLFWNMATATLFSPTRAAQTIELLCPILCAFLCAHALAPEQDGVGELVFVRPLSLEKVLLLRLVVIFAFVFAVVSPAFIIYKVGIADFPLGLTILAAVPSMLLMSALAMGLASATRRPIVGLGGAGAFWVLDMTKGRYFNPLASLHGFSDYLAAQPMAEQWVAGKLVLIGMAAVIYMLLRRRLGRPASPRRWMSVVRSAALAVVLLLVYVTSGAAYKVAYGIGHERELANRSRLWYQLQFRGYGPLPVAWMFGPAFPLYVQAELGSDLPVGGGNTGTLWTPVDISQMELLLERYPKSIWADNAQFEVATYRRRQPGGRPLLVIGCEAGDRQPSQTWVREDMAGTVEEYQRLVEDYPESPFAPLALSQQALIGLSLLDFELPRSSYERMLKDYPDDVEAYAAGMGLSVLYLSEGEWEKALEAADIAANVALWDVKGEALFAAAQAAEGAGEEEIARDRYARAREAAHDAVERAIKGEKGPTRLTKGDLFERSNAVMEACDAALSGESRPVSVAAAGTEVVGRIVKDDRGLPGVRVAIGASPGPRGLPSPFVSGPAVSATTDAEGAFRMTGVPPGEYGFAAFALELEGGEGDYSAEGLELPIVVTESPVVLPGVTIQTWARGRDMPGVRQGPPERLSPDDRRGTRDRSGFSGESEGPPGGGRGRRGGGERPGGGGRGSRAGGERSRVGGPGSREGRR
jgi:tetratricopeptide (TPR) repeat protein